MFRLSALTIFVLTSCLPFQTCKPYCRFDNETTQITSMDNQLCCNIVGVGPTGICKNGACLIGGILALGRN
ncbi:hypothetical protein CEXT_158341 [Caerostris extrusa]|uniref:Uncharacterized protein n=1 Tax=Caerostris extrusa TaxID=172846 RepID=A0AAV4XHC2_CAEEX|nr:hypothetical protein CEXT_158341 [Caerostris extrusa]